MIKLSKLKLLSLLLLVACFVGSSQAHTAAFGLPDNLDKDYSQAVVQKVVDACASKLNLSTKKDADAPKISACAYGYLKAVKGGDASACDKALKKDDQVKICKNTGFPLGKSDPVKAGGEKGEGGGSDKTVGQGNNCNDTHCDLVALYINPFIDLLSIVVGLVVAASLIMGGIQYASSSGDPQKTGAAKKRITDTLLAFLAYIFMYAFLNFLIPGGLF